MQSPEEQSRMRRWMQFWPLAIIVVALISPCVSMLPNLYWGIRHRHVADRMETAILSLAIHRPREVTEDQWAYCIFSTWNLQGNYGSVPSYVPTNDLERIVEGLEERIDRGPNLATIDRVWDQYFEAYPRAKSYDEFRPTAPRNRADFEAGNHCGNPLSHFRSRYEERVAQNSQ